MFWSAAARFLFFPTLTRQEWLAHHGWNLYWSDAPSWARGQDRDSWLLPPRCVWGLRVWRLAFFIVATFWEWQEHIHETSLFILCWGGKVAAAVLAAWWICVRIQKNLANFALEAKKTWLRRLWRCNAFSVSEKIKSAFFYPFLARRRSPTLWLCSLQSSPSWSHRE